MAGAIKKRVKNAKGDAREKDIKKGPYRENVINRTETAVDKYILTKI